jgi:uncharacterized membrane protein YphA (DoxX/SURF4 family)
MFQSLRTPQLVLRIGLAIVFVWFGIDKFIQPHYWVDAWMPLWAQHASGAVGMSTVNAVFFVGLFEVLVAISLATGFFMRWFSVAAIGFLFLVILTHGLTEVLVRDVGLIGGLLALALWPERRYI